MQESYFYRNKTSGEEFLYLLTVAPYREHIFNKIKDKKRILIVGTGPIGGFVEFELVSLVKPPNRIKLTHDINDEYLIIYQCLFDGIRYTTTIDSFSSRFELI